MGWQAGYLHTPLMGHMQSVSSLKNGVRRKLFTSSVLNIIVEVASENHWSRFEKI
jgi:hypothetical protein